MRSAALETVVLAFAAFASFARTSTAADCNSNGRPDSEEIALGAAPDCNSNGVPDPCDLLPVRFSRPRFLSVRTGSRPPATGDFDLDGYLDLAHPGSEAGSILVLRNRGDLAFDAAAAFPDAEPAFYTWIYDLDAADFDGDGDLDLAAADGNSGEVFILENDGAGNFRMRGRLVNQSGYRSIAAGDIDGDGDQDLVTGGLLIFLNDGNFTFRSFSRLEGADPEALADLDGDGDLDLATSMRNPDRIELFFNRGDGGFDQPVMIPMEAGPQSIIAGDLDGDGDFDLAAVTGNTFQPGPGISVHINEGGGRFRGPIPQPVQGGSLRAAAGGDLDGDGDLDLALLSGGPGTVLLLLNQGDGALVEASKLTAGDLPVAVAVSDLDGDGSVELLVLDQVPCCPDARRPPGSIRIFPGRGGGTFGPPVVLPAVGTPVALLTADLDGDGRLDLAVANELSGIGPDHLRFPDVVSVYRNSGGGDFSGSRNYAAGGDSITLLTAGDFDADGDTDLAAAVRVFVDSRVSILINAGDGTYLPGGLLPFQAARFNDLIALDIDGDGWDEVVAAYGGFYDVLAVLENSASPAASRDADLDGIPDEFAIEIAFHRGDVDGDGRLAITDPISIFGHLFRGGEPGCREAADVDNDGRIDIADGIWLLLHLFLDGPPPVSPGPPPAPCGQDSDPPGSAGDLGCLRYSGC